jgi:hypothetical protein
MPIFGNTNSNLAVAVGDWRVVLLLACLAVVVVVGYVLWPSSATSWCPKELKRQTDGTLKLHPNGQEFADMNAFQLWWHSSGLLEKCPIPLLTGAREVSVMESDQQQEETYAKTPIYKVDDYEFSRIFGIERGGRMVEGREDYNKILMERFFDWADRPMTSDERKKSYAGLKEGFTADGDLTSEIVNRYGEKRAGRRSEGDDDIDCKISREAKEVAEMVAKSYESDPNWEPVITKVGANHWEVNELKPKRRQDEEMVYNDRVVDTSNSAVDVEFRYREKQITDAALDPYFSGGDATDSPTADPFYGPVPGMERMFGPTMDHVKWY